MVELDLKLLLQSKPSDVAAYYRKISTPETEDDITVQLFKAVEADLLPPTVFAPWLGISKSPNTIVAAIRQEFSVEIRTNAIDGLSTRLRREQMWAESWAAIGGTEGIIRTMENLSIYHLKLFVRLVARMNGLNNPAKQVKVTEVLKGLLSSLYPESPVQNTDQRPLLDHYVLLVPFCTAEFVDDLLVREDNTLLQSAMHRLGWQKNLMRNHRDVLRKHCMESVFENKKTAVQIQIYLDLLLNGRNNNDGKSELEGYSESMLFSLQFLKKLIANPEIAVPGYSIVKSLIEPLLRRAKKRRFFTPSKFCDLIDLALTYLSAHPNEAKGADCGGLTFIRGLVKFWNIPVHRDVFELRIIKALDVGLAAESMYDTLNLAQSLMLVDVGLRYRLLRLLLIHRKGEGRDVDTLEGLRGLSTAIWSTYLILALERSAALVLLKRLIDIYGDDDFLSGDHQAHHLTGSAFDDEVGSRVLGESKSLVVYLEVGNEGALERAKGHIEEHKKRANKAREQTERAAHARNALRFGLLSGNMGTYAETLKWCERFVRDPLTVRTLFAKDIIGSPKETQLLSGIPPPHKRDKDKKPDLEALHKSVLEGNELVFGLFELACKALKEPSFFQYYWNAPLKVLGPVIVARLNYAKSLHHDHGVSDDLLYKLFWENALELSIRMEALCLDPEYKKLEMRSLDGSLAFDYSLSNKPTDPASTFKFFEELAKARDELWKKHRRSLNPTAAIIPQPLPMGLPIQCVYPVNPRDWLANDKTPYITSRAETIVFAGSESLQPISEDRELLAAIGAFVDNYTFALQIYVTQAPTEEERQTRFQQAWIHAITKLSPSMTPEEAHRRWRRNFILALPKFTVPDPDLYLWKKAKYPILNFKANNGDFTEWDPLDRFRPSPEVRARVIEPVTWLDCAVYYTSPYYSAENNRFTVPRPETIAVPSLEGNIWELERLTKSQVREPEIREGLIISALQYLELRLEPSESSEYMLQQAFPLEDGRYPALWLDEENINKKSQNIAGPLRLLRCLSDTTPPTLLLKLTNSAFNKLVKTGPEGTTAQIGEITYRLLMLLSRSDRPWLASQLILDSMIKLPSASSWHRQLLSSYFLNDLPPEKAKDFIRLFDESITDALAAQQAARVAKPTGKEGEKKSVGPYVKISTIKYLPQLLNRSSIIPASFSIQILKGLFVKSEHIDIRVAIVDTLVSMLITTFVNDTLRDEAQQLITALQAIVPVASRFDERVDIKWEELGPESELPEAFDFQKSNPDHSMPALLEAVIKVLEKGMGKDINIQLMELIFLPIIRGSISSNTSWLELFTAKYGLDFHALDIPRLPVKPGFLMKMIEHERTATGELLKLYYDFLIVNISPPERVVQLNKRLRDNPKLRNLPETKHWLSLYGHGAKVHDYGTLRFASLPIDWTRTKPNSPESIDSVVLAQKYVQDLGEELLLRAPDEVSTFMSPLQRHFFFWNSSQDCDWETASIPVLSHLIAKVESLRTPSWQKDPARVPRTLPDVLDWKVWMLPYPKTEARSPETLEFVNKFCELLEDITAIDMAYHHSFAKLKTAAVNVLRKHRAQVACLLGTLHDNMKLIDWLKVEIAADLFKNASLPEAEVRQEVVAKSKAVLKSWRESEVEWARGQGQELAVEGNFDELPWGKEVCN